MLTNADRWTDAPILSAHGFAVGQYDFVFHADAYYGRAKDTRYLDKIPIRFGINEPASHWQGPLLVSPFSFSTYRGS